MAVSDSPWGWSDEAVAAGTCVCPIQRLRAPTFLPLTASRRRMPLDWAVSSVSPAGAMWWRRWWKGSATRRSLHPARRAGRDPRDNGPVSDPSLTVLALLGLAAVAAGFVDAVVGGGGLIQLPALLLGLPNVAPVQVLATNKLASVFGTTMASATYYRRVRPDPRTFVPLMLAAFAGSAAGAGVASHLPSSVFEPIVLVALVLVGAWVVFRPDLGEVTELRFAGHH